MKKYSWVVVLALALVMVPAVLSAQAFQSDNEKPEGTISGNVERLAIPPAAVGIGKTINIPPGAFNYDGTSLMAYFISFSGGYIRGTSDTAVCLVAPVIFPKQAKKIKYFDWCCRVDSAGSGCVAIYDSNGLTSAAASCPFYYFPDADGYYVWWRWTPFKGYALNWSHVYYVCLWLDSYSYYKSVIVTYQ